MLTADGLLLQASNCNNQNPAKLHEYLRADRPIIIALADPAGNTAAGLKKAGIDIIAPLDCKNDIMRALLRFIALAKEFQHQSLQWQRYWRAPDDPGPESWATCSTWCLGIMMGS